MNKKTVIFVAFLFLYLFCTIDTILLAEKGIDLNSIEHLEKIHENPHKPHEKQDEPSNKLKKPKTIKKIRKKNKILEDKCITIVDISEVNNEVKSNIYKTTITNIIN